MCNALRELMKEEFEEELRKNSEKGKEIAKEIGRAQLADAIKRLRNGENVESIEASGIDRETVVLAQTLK